MVVFLAIQVLDGYYYVTQKILHYMVVCVHVPFFSARFLVPQRKKPYFMCLGLTHSIYHLVLEIITLETN